MIKKLERAMIYDFASSQELSIMPTQQHVMDKINELVDFANRLSYNTEERDVDSFIDELLKEMAKRVK